MVDLLKKFGFDDPYFLKVKPLDLNDCYLLFNEASNESMFEATTNDQTFLTDSFSEIMDSIIIPPFSVLNLLIRRMFRKYHQMRLWRRI